MSLLELLSLKNELAKPSTWDGGTVTHGCAYVNHRVRCGLHFLRNSLLTGQSTERAKPQQKHTGLLTVTIPPLTQMK